MNLNNRLYLLGLGSLLFIFIPKLVYSNHYLEIMVNPTKLIIPGGSINLTFLDDFQNNSYYIELYKNNKLYSSFVCSKYGIKGYLNFYKNNSLCVYNLSILSNTSTNYNFFIKVYKILNISNISKNNLDLILTKNISIPIISPKINIDLLNNQLCAPFGIINLKINIEDPDLGDDYNKYTIKVYLNNTLIKSFKYNINKNIYNISVNTTEVGNKILKVEIYKDNIKIKEKKINITFLKPFNINLVINNVTTNSFSSIYIQKNCNYISNNISFDIYINNKLVRKNCSFFGDPDWGLNECGFPVNESPGNYNVYVSYKYGNLFFREFIGTINVIKPSLYSFVSSKCYHGWGSEDTLNYNLNIEGEYTKKNNIYIISKGSSISFNNLRSYLYICSDGARNKWTPIFGVWIYKDGQFIKYIENTPDSFNIDYFSFKENIKNYGFLRSHIVGTSTSINNILTNLKPGHYILYLGEMKSFCNSPSKYICPYENTLCKIGHMAEGGRWIGYIDLGKINIIVPEPNISGDFENIDYIFGSKETVSLYLGYVKNIGVGNVNIDLKSFIYNNSYNLEEGSLAYLYLKIPYTIYKISKCNHKDCSIKYYIYYDDAYNLKSYKKTLYHEGTINIKWNKLNIIIPKQNIYYGKDNVFKIKIKNIGPKTAGDVKIYNLKYNKSCIDAQILNNNPKTIDVYDESIFKLKINIKNLHCNPEDYKISFDVYGWNTYKYHKEIQLPISYINIPSNESFIKPTFSVDIIDKNAKNCYIKEDNIESKRECNKIYVSSKCNFEEDPICIIDSIAENNYARFHYINTYYLATEIADLLKITVPKYIQISSTENPSFEILIKNTADIPINYSIFLYNFTPLVSIKEIYLNGNPITFNKKITINPHEIQKIKIVLNPLKSGIKTAYLRIVKYDPIKTYEIPITISVAPTSTKDINSTKVKLLYTSQIASKTPTTTPEFINPYILLLLISGYIYNRFRKI